MDDTSTPVIDGGPRTWQAVLYIVAGLGFLIWEWSRDHTTVWIPGRSEVILIVTATLAIAIGLRMLLTPGAHRALWRADAWTDRYTLAALVTGIVHGYILGAGQALTEDALREFAPVLLICGLVGGVLAVRNRRARMREEGSQD